jgi:DNA-binding response OmpR family regulator
VKILIVDDDIEVRRIVRYALTLSSDFEVVEADSALPALRKAVEERPDAILLDMMMPEIDGLGLLRLLKVSPATSRIPVILLSTASAVSDIGPFRGLGAAAVLTKPFIAVELARDVRNALKIAA